MNKSITSIHRCDKPMHIAGKRSVPLRFFVLEDGERQGPDSMPLGSSPRRITEPRQCSFERLNAALILGEEPADFWKLRGGRMLGVEVIVRKMADRRIGMDVGRAHRLNPMFKRVRDCLGTRWRRNGADYTQNDRAENRTVP
jgi:hypothetical protein